MATGSAIPKDWEPSNGDREYGHTILHLSDHQIDEMATDMKLWAGANSNRQIARKADWSLTFMGWMRREAKRTMRFPPPSRSQNGSGPRGKKTLSDIFAEAKEKIDAAKEH